MKNTQNRNFAWRNVKKVHCEPETILELSSVNMHVLQFVCFVWMRKYFVSPGYGLCCPFHSNCGWQPTHFERKSSPNGLSNFKCLTAKRATLMAMLHEAIFLATFLTMMTEKHCKLQRGCHTFAIFFRNLQCTRWKWRYFYFSCNSQRNILLHCRLHKWSVTRKIFLATCLATFVARQVARNIASCNMALTGLIW